jgi:hypothetical protein
LNNHGKVSHEVALTLAVKEYEKYREIRNKNYISDFDKEIKRIESISDEFDIH